MLDLFAENDFRARLASKVKWALHEQSVKAWARIKGCAARCPLCGSKCDQVGEHTHHKCAHHLLPCFHGWMERESGRPALRHCHDAFASKEGTYSCPDGSWKPIGGYLEQVHPQWLPFETNAHVRDVNRYTRDPERDRRHGPVLPGVPAAGHPV